MVCTVQQQPTCQPKPAIEVGEIIAYMAQHLDKPLQVATLAARANISSSYFFTLFKRQTGSAPMKYFTRLRMQRACQLLEGTSLSVKMIAFALGYRDFLYFSRVFKLANRVAPNNYRAEQRKMTGKAIENSGEIQIIPANTNGRSLTLAPN